MKRDHTFVPVHCSFAYSTLASFRMGMSGSASFQSGRKIWLGAFLISGPFLTETAEQDDIGIVVASVGDRKFLAVA